ncbi:MULTISPECIES: hypothetical protein [Dickeya]|uniref:Orn/Lys/Arg decarboxylase C-terminal domain-containing protein n=2 Tax=Dickeya TaxID=204037 RepID=A0A375AGV1_9GAMM|nr:MULTISPECIES: hypothetical protein [Dickeya]WFN54424.1 hypothetical protein O1Q98_12075 [Dickeya lacustris]SLM65136.1 hypothetical protein DAQ1742_04391 [Dickeya aquatica]
MTQGKEEKESVAPCVISDKFIIPYPPGVPILFPGEEISDAIQQKINECRDNGLLIIAA